MTADYGSSIFINCPFTEDFSPIYRALVFAVVDCGFRPRTALEAMDSGQSRLDKIEKLIEESKLGIHDLSNMELDPVSNLPRFNMPFELGVFMGAARYGDPKQRQKKMLILDSDRYRYQAALSDISGQDIKCHNGEADEAIRCVRDWLETVTTPERLPGATHIIGRYAKYKSDLPTICSTLKLAPQELTFNDLWETMVAWEQISSDDVD